MARSASKLKDEASGRGVTAVDGSTKARIERAALSLFAKGEMDKATTRAIAAQAGISEGALYRHYTSKEDIWEGLFFTIHQRLGDLVMAAALSDDHIRGQAAALVNAYCETADDDWQLFCFHILSLHRFLQREHDQTRNPVFAAELIVRKAMESKQIPDGDVVLVAGMAMGVVMQPSLLKAYGRLQGNLSGFKPQLTAGVISVLNPHS